MRKGMKFFRNVVLALVGIIMLLPGQAFAADLIDTSAKTSLTVQFVPAGIVAEGTQFSLYRVADVSKLCEFTITKKFAGYGLEVAEDITQAGWREMAATLQGYINADQIEPDYTAKVDAAGNASFQNMSVGLYLVIGDVFQSGNTYYTPQSYMICLPNLDENDTWQYDVASVAKYESQIVEEPVSLEILKIWKDNNYSGRPKGIVIEVYEGSQLYKTITLNEDNNWRYQLTDLDAGSVWSVKEKDVPKGYTVSVENQTNRIVVTNTRPEVPDEPDEPELPQTGVLWWPVCVLAAAGLLLIVLGYIRRKGNTNEN